MVHFKLVRFAPPAIARHERGGHNWNDGTMEYWNIGSFLDRIEKN